MLVDRGHLVRVIDRFFFGTGLLPNESGIEIIREDVRRLKLCHFEGVDAVIDLAAVSNDPSGEMFQDATMEINFGARARTAELAKLAGVKRYVLPSSCSIYGFQAQGVIATETSATNSLTTYARANEMAEEAVLSLASSEFTVVVVRQATVYGYSPRMRFDLAINGMTFGGWKTGRLPLMRDGTQWRPMIHVRDTSRALIFMLDAEAAKVNGQIYNVGSERNNYQLGPLAKIVAAALPSGAEIEWYGDTDHRSYRAGFDKIEALGWRAQFGAEDGVREIVAMLEVGELDKTASTITLDWYKLLTEWHRRIRDLELHGGILDI